MVYLERNDLIGENNVAFVKKMLEFISRKNLIPKVELYEEGMNQRIAEKKLGKESVYRSPGSERHTRKSRPLSQEINGVTYRSNFHGKQIRRFYGKLTSCSYNARKLTIL